MAHVGRQRQPAEGRRDECRADRRGGADPRAGSGMQQTVAAAPIVVQKVGGSSLATPELRAVAARRVIDALKQGRRPVVVTSAMGRLPAPYATDSLIALAPDAQDGPNRDLLLACGEQIAASVFAEVLTALGAPARALTGGLAGIVTDAAHGNANVQSIDPGPVRELLAAGITPVIAGFQGVAEDRSEERRV